MPNTRSRNNESENAMKTLLLFGIGLSALSPLFAFAVAPGTDPQDYPGGAWSPYLVGGLIGVLSMLTFYFSDKPLGASTGYARLAGMLGSVVAPKHMARSEKTVAFAI